MPRELTLDYYCMVELDLLNCIVACVQRLYLELKFHKILAGEYQTASELLKEHKEVDTFLANN